MTIGINTQVVAYPPRTDSGAGVVKDVDNSITIMVLPSFPKGDASELEENTGFRYAGSTLDFKVFMSAKTRRIQENWVLEYEGRDYRVMSMRPVPPRGAFMIVQGSAK